MFKITMGKGFHIEYANGWKISVQFGYGNYCHNRDVQPDNWDADGYTKHNHKMGADGCDTAEIAIYDHHGDMVQRDGEHDVVIGWLTPDQVLAHMLWTSQQ